MSKFTTTAICLTAAIIFSGCTGKEASLEESGKNSIITAKVMHTLPEKELLEFPMPTVSYQQKFLALAAEEDTPVSFTPDRGLLHYEELSDTLQRLL